VLTDPQDGDVGSIMGLGFAPQTGGAISLIDQVGVKQFVAECDELAKKYGKQFEVPEAAARHGRQGRELLRQADGQGGVTPPPVPRA
jgi:3-hydroxyacyl-CoA dehydrogenase/enoyl-CoA hydratase/3-hydroxybutyryl-CoA epimerase